LSARDKEGLPGKTGRSGKGEGRAQGDGPLNKSESDEKHLRKEKGMGPTRNGRTTKAELAKLLAMREKEGNSKRRQTPSSDIVRGFIK